MTDGLPELWDVDRVCVYLHCSRHLVYRLTRERRIRFVRVGKELRFRRDDVSAWLEDESVPSRAAKPPAATPTARSTSQLRPRRVTRRQLPPGVRRRVWPSGAVSYEASLRGGAAFTDDDTESGVKAGELLTRELFMQLLQEEHVKPLRADSNDVHDDSKATTLPIARAIAEADILEHLKAPWYIDLLNLNLNVTDLTVAEERIRRFLDAFGQDGTRITRNLDFDSEN